MSPSIFSTRSVFWSRSGGMSPGKFSGASSYSESWSSWSYSLKLKVPSGLTVSSKTTVVTRVVGLVTGARIVVDEGDNLAAVDLVAEITTLNLSP